MSAKSNLVEIIDDVIEDVMEDGFAILAITAIQDQLIFSAIDPDHYDQLAKKLLLMNAKYYPTNEKGEKVFTKQ